MFRLPRHVQLCHLGPTGLVSDSTLEYSLSYGEEQRSEQVNGHHTRLLCVPSHSLAEPKRGFELALQKHLREFYSDVHTIDAPLMHVVCPLNSRVKVSFTAGPDGKHTEQERFKHGEEEITRQVLIQKAIDDTGASLKFGCSWSAVARRNLKDPTLKEDWKSDLTVL